MLYKYRAFDENALLLLINRSLHFAGPDSLNDPHDCRVGILSAFGSATSSQDIWKEISKLIKLREPRSNPRSLLKKLEFHIRKKGILSLSRDCLDVIMWSHYAEGHSGFCIGFEFSDDFRSSVFCGPTECIYTADNRFMSYFADSTEPESESDFWLDMILLTLLTKSTDWKHEQEERFIRHSPGDVNFSPTELREIIFGLKMKEGHNSAIKNLLYGAEWRHVVYHQTQINPCGFGLCLR